ncbi:bifunctional proline dehydrogenase/L-glutamate gamma-semialdehyde dehydrogenase PutA [Maritalea porphyrae]|uniref:bifunctional proline dehydrogenase/L-glutamate gamma-semialdehyde dehydrogenase PutA n=1 Tax=Maritalea porphyrae TaxID=880732 RepID=UPI0022AEAC70|nr:bifunctional proline dehydrogenase/L-glutamate gamma-semialdehyde dehydrogenase PutA [Maritalea porphyrae]MCZ4272293.1 bifunctional proline dehydrogenase/L-glutamate gamma-semialdehyde dehydrogenase PutA [Maritalea porphyrae]
MLDKIREEIRAHYLPDEDQVIERLVVQSKLSETDRHAIVDDAANLVSSLRDQSKQGLMETFLAEYGLSTDEGVSLMCLAEAMLRVPDGPTVDDLIADKIVDEDWLKHLGVAESFLVQASTLGLVVSSALLDGDGPGVMKPIAQLSKRLSAPVIRTAVGQAMRIMGSQFVLGRDINEALKNGSGSVSKGYTYSFDMLGEGARTQADAQRYHKAYLNAIERLAKESTFGDVRKNPGISIKLSALHPRYEYIKRDTVVNEMVERVIELVKPAAQAQMGLNIDAEEADRLDLSLDIIEKVLKHPDLEGWDGFGVVVQAYGPRAAFVIDWLYALAQKLDRKIMVRLVKGAYWDTEVKRAQVMGLSGYPVFTRKVNTDISYLGCARKLLDMQDRIYPQFATHNAHTTSAVLRMAGNEREGFEFQRLHGMGEGLHDVLRQQNGTRCRIYAPVGAHRDLLAYLVRRLLENGANSSFVNQAYDKKIPPRAIVSDPVGAHLDHVTARNTNLPLPREIFGVERKNAKGWDFTDVNDVRLIHQESRKFAAPFQWRAKASKALGEGAKDQPVFNPSNPSEIVGFAENVTPDQVQKAIGVALEGQKAWGATDVVDRAGILKRAATMFEERATEFFALATREAGKSLPDGIAEVREAVDFLRYYANEGLKAEHQGDPRGVIGCISPWNFPLAIFTGQVAAALVTGNAVVAKPAEQSPLMGGLAVSILHDAGVPKDALLLVAGAGDIGAALTADPRIGGICFTGSTEVAKLIDMQLAKTAASDAMLIAETGGLNAMIVDSTALAEQAVRDIVASAFQSAGQRCSALRMLYVQQDIADDLLEMLYGAMEALKMGDPWDDATDVGPVIDADAQAEILTYCEGLEKQGRLLRKLEAPQKGYFVAPHIFKVDSINDLEREIFGPILHVATFKARQLDQVIADINGRGFGLTFGLHTRVDDRIEKIGAKIKVGNFYVNRNQIGAIVGSQPFGGEGLSGTGPKAGGPNYLNRFRNGSGARDLDLDTASIGKDAIAHAFADLEKGKWAALDDRAALLGVEPVAMQCELPGPTGELNRLSYTPRGKMLLLGAGEGLVDLAKMALALGNKVVVVTPEVSAQLAQVQMVGAPIAVLEGVVDPAVLSELEIDGVGLAASGAFAQSVRLALAKRKGPIVPVITNGFDVAGFVHERAICVDTTAAGGNASLLAQSS